MTEHRDFEDRLSEAGGRYRTLLKNKGAGHKATIAAKHRYMGLLALEAQVKNEQSERA